MTSTRVSSVPLPRHSLWKKVDAGTGLLSFELEITARCNNDCRHCYINLPADDPYAMNEELSPESIFDIADEAVSLGALWCLLTGGEPLLRDDFFDLYMGLKKRGLLVSLCTNATLLTKEHVTLFQKYPPRDVEVTVYGVTAETYERVTRRPGSFDAFMNGLRLIRGGGVPIRLKAMALRSNVHEFPAIAEFCRKNTKDYYRFDPLLHLRYDRNPVRNEEIKAERLSPTEIAALDQKDSKRSRELTRKRRFLTERRVTDKVSRLLFQCGAGRGSFAVSYDGKFRLCFSLWHPDCTFDLRTGSLAEAWTEFVPKIRSLESTNSNFLEHCRRCPIVNLCMWCPAHTYLETGRLDQPVDYFCKVAHARAKALSGHRESRDSLGSLCGDSAT